MRIGLMLRALDEKGGIGVYTRNLVEELLDLDRDNHYVLLYRNPANLGRFADRPNASERLVRGGNNAYWDQIAIPYVCWREKLDLVFHPKFSVPLLAPCRAVMVVHGADWFIPEQAKYYGRLEVLYARLLMPLYFRKSSRVISVSELTTQNFRRILGLVPEKIRTVYFGPARHFEPVRDEAKLAEVRARYGLPERFIFTLTKQRGEGRKNLGQLLKAYARYHAREDRPRRLVIGGLGCDRFRATYRIPQTGHGRDILFPGWIDQEDLPAVYSLADLYLYPSNLEAFPIPLTEAMACGTPIVTSRANGLEEIAGDAALLVDPDDADEIAETIARVLADASLRASLSERGLLRARNFSWAKCARETLGILEQLNGSAQASS